MSQKARNAQKKVEFSYTSSSQPKNQEIKCNYYLDLETGEVLNVPVQTSNFENCHDVGFEKIWLKEFVSSLDQLANKKMKVFNALLEVKDESGNILASIEEIAKKAGVHYQTVYSTLRILKANDFLTKRGGHYMINPKIIIKGSHQKRVMLGKIYEFNRSNKSSDINTQIKGCYKQIYELSEALNRAQNSLEKLKLKKQKAQLDKEKS